MPSERGDRDDDGIDASVCARSGAPALSVMPRPSAAYLRKDAARLDRMAAVMRTRVPVSDLLV
jgi:hypothetical protein